MTRKYFIPGNFAVSVIFVIQFTLWCLPEGVYALGGFVDVSIGYDNNPAVTNQQTVGRRPVTTVERVSGSAFGYVDAGVGHLFSPYNELDLEIQIGGSNTSYLNSGNKSEAIAAVTISRPLSEGLFIPAILAGGSLYRDTVVSTNDLNEALTGLRFVLHPAGRMSLMLESVYHWLDYTEDLELLTGHGAKGGGHAAFHGGRHGPGCRNSVSRNDKLWETEAAADLFLTPELTGLISFKHTRNDSSIKQASYHQIEISFGFLFEPFPDWQGEALATWFHTDYDHAPKDLPGTEQNWSVDARLSKIWKTFEFFAGFIWKQNVTLVEGENDTRTVSQAGISWSF